MKSFLILLVAILATASSFAQKNKASSNSANKTIIVTSYSCPMHPDVVSNQPGKCPKCNMDLSLSKKEQMKMEVMKSYSCPMHPEVVSDHSGTCAKCSSQLVVDRKGSKQGNKIYTCSMHADVASDKPGKCPICNMDLTKTKEKSKAKKG
jgi:hypothetical protein